MARCLPITIACTNKRIHYSTQITCQSDVKWVPFTVVKKGRDYDLRLIEPHTIAKTVYVRRDEGFLRLGNYMSGANADKRRCYETQPIVMSYYPNEDRKTMHVYAAPRGDEGNQAPSAPMPTEEGVALDIFGGFIVAVKPFSGNATEQVCQQVRDELVKAIQADGLSLGIEEETSGVFRLAQIGEMFSVQRYNEIWLQVRL